LAVLDYAAIAAGLLIGCGAGLERRRCELTRCRRPARHTHPPYRHRVSEDTSMKTLNYELAKSVEGHAFSVVIDAEVEYQLRLVAVNVLDTSAHARTDERESFALVFEGIAGQFCAQRTYTFRNDTIGEHQIFIVPIGCQRDVHAYEAVFN